LIEEQGRGCLYVKAPGKIRFFVHVNLYYLEPPCPFSSQLVQYRRNNPACAAPLGPEFYK